MLADMHLIAISNEQIWRWNFLAKNSLFIYSCSKENWKGGKLMWKRQKWDRVLHSKICLFLVVQIPNIHLAYATDFQVIYESVKHRDHMHVIWFMQNCIIHWILQNLDLWLQILFVWMGVKNHRFIYMIVRGIYLEDMINHFAQHLGTHLESWLSLGKIAGIECKIYCSQLKLACMNSWLSQLDEISFISK